MKPIFTLENDYPMDALNLSDFTYHLPEERIAAYPLENRDQSRLLCYKKGKIRHRTFSDLPDLVPAASTLFFNNTKVLPARLFFQKSTGARIEIFLLEPVSPSPEVATAMAARSVCTWKCMIGNLKKWKQEDLELELPGKSGNHHLAAVLTDRDEGLVTFRWDSGDTFSEVVHAAGNLPLPPYIKREAEESDYDRYQTVYARLDGAVAAPTAGLHFTDSVLEKLKRKGVRMNELTLHVSAGTFQPIKAAIVTSHQMHSEEIVIRKDNLKALKESDFRIAVGTTSMRTLESLYWFGAKLLADPSAVFDIGQDDPYTIKPVSLEQSLHAVRKRMDLENTDFLTGRTGIFIYPGYNFRVCQGLITNFHLPGSTLILLVAAFVGEDWKTIYQEALQGQYRFLSYGDSSLLLP